MSREEGASLRRISAEDAATDAGFIGRFSDYIRAAFNQRHAKKQALVDMINNENKELLLVIEKARSRNKEFNME